MSKRKLIQFVVSVTVFAGCASLFAQNAPAPAAPTASAEAPVPDVGGPTAVWRDPSKTPDQRARDILPRLTLKEKISLLHGDGTFTTPGLPRFGSRKLWMSDGPMGVREEIQQNNFNSANRTDDFSTALPADIALAASFDAAMGAAYGSVIGEEARTRGKNIMLGPGLNIMRTPLNGRNSEYLGEDPFLSSRMAVGFINSLQSYGVAACAKHYALNNQEINRGSVNVHVDERAMREIYLPAFKAAVTEGRAWAIMSAYNRVNGQYCSENDFLLNRVLKKDWNFQGLVMTDWGGCHSTVDAANNGLDLEMGSNLGGSPSSHDRDFLADALLQAVTADNPKVPMSRIDDMALRNLRVMFATGIFDPLPDNAKAIPLMSPEHIATARKIAENGIVLLKNKDGLLPIDPGKVKKIAVIGDNAQATFAQFGDSARIKTKYETTPLEGIRKRAGDDVAVNYVQGYARPQGRGRGGPGAPAGAAAPAGGTDAAKKLIDEAADAAKNADLSVVVAGLYRNQDQESMDRPNFDLPPGQAELIAAICKANPRTVVVLNGGSPSSVESWIDDCGGLIMYWYGGTEGGNALARILFGDANPSAHLPCTWPRKLTDVAPHSTGNAAEYPGTSPGGARGGFGRGTLAPDAGPQENYTEGVLVGYRWFDAKKIEPRFPFGFGLSYTTFEIADLKVAQNAAGQAADPLRKPVAEVSATVTNTGSREGAQVVQVYVEQAKPSIPRPPRELKGFAKVNLAKGQRSTVTIPLDISSFAYFDQDKHAWVAEAGEYTIWVGDCSRNLPLKATFNLPQTVTVPEGK